MANGTKESNMSNNGISQTAAPRHPNTTCNVRLG